MQPVGYHTAMRHDDAIEGIRDAEDVEDAILTLFGETPMGTGIIHPTAVWQGPMDCLVTLATGESMPRCGHDAFVLGLARARADVIITTGRVLRHEPTLDHRLPGEVLGEALLDWRLRRLGKERPPATVILSSGRELDLDHPVFRHWTRPMVYTSREGQWILESRAADHGVEVIAADQPSIQGAVEAVRRELGAATIDLEAGPGVASELYNSGAVDELLLSTYEAPRLDAQAEGPLFLAASEVSSYFGDPVGETQVEAANGPWRLRRYCR